MPVFHFRLVNVFVGSERLTANALAGNPLCVFPDARGLDLGRMIALTRQFNLSETTFVFPESGRDSVRVRIFTPTPDPAQAEMRFAGHPTLGTAHVVRSLHGGDAITLDLPAGRVPVSADGDVWTLTAPFDGAPALRVEPLDAARVAALVGLDPGDLAGPPTWVDTGTEQLLVPVRDAATVARARPAAGGAADWPGSRDGRRNAYVFAVGSGAASPDGRIPVRSRFFVQPNGAAAFEDPGTGSACANLGGWLIGTGAACPGRYAIDQGVEMQRPCRLLLDLTADARVRVGGQVVEIARGDVTID